MPSRSVSVGRAVFFGAAGLVCVFYIALCLGMDLYVTAIGMVGTPLVCVGLAVNYLELGSQVSPRAETDGSGTTFRPDRGLDIALQTVVLGGFVCSLGVIYSSVHLVALRREQDGWPPAYGWPTVVFALSVVTLGALLVWRYLRWGASRYLRLTLAGIDLGHLRRQSCDWDQICDIVTVVPGRPAWTRARFPYDVVVVISDSSSLRLPAGPFAFNGPALRDLVEFYLRHPEARGELTDGSATRRLAALLPVRP